MLQFGYTFLFGSFAASVFLVTSCGGDGGGGGGGGGADAAGAQVFEAAPQEVRAVPAKRAAPDYFL